MKMQYPFKLWCFCCGLVFLAFSASAQPLSDTLQLDVFLRMARQKAIAGLEADASKEQAQLNFKLFQTNLKPQLSAYANLPNYAKTFSEIVQPDGTILFQPITNNNSEIGLDLTQEIPATGGSVFLHSDLQRFDNFESKDHLYNGVPFRLGFFQPLFAFNQLKWEKRIQPLRYQEAQKKYHADLEQINIEAANLFFDLLEASQNLGIATFNETSNRALLRIAQERYDLGKISRRDLIQLKLELASAQKDQWQTRRAVQRASSEIYIYLGLPYQDQLIIPAIPQVKTDIAVDAEVALREAKLNRHEIESFVRQLLEADRDVAQAKGDGGFRMDLSASFGLVRSAKVVEDIYNDPQQEQFVQLQVNIPIVDWGRQKSKVGISKVQQSLVKEQVKRNRLTFETQIVQVVQQFKNLQEEMKLMDNIRDMAQQRFQITKETYVLGAISITELTLAQAEKDRAVRDYIFTLNQYWTQYLRLRSFTLYDFEKGQRLLNH